MTDPKHLAPGLDLRAVAKPCKACDALMVWVHITKKDGTPGKMPVDLEPTAAGTYAITKVDGKLVGTWVKPPQRRNVPVHTSHFATCPQADRFRSGGR